MGYGSTIFMLVEAMANPLTQYDPHHALEGGVHVSNVGLFT